MSNKTNQTNTIYHDIYGFINEEIEERINNYENKRELEGLTQDLGNPYMNSSFDVKIGMGKGESWI